MGVRLDNAKALYMEGIRDGKFVEAINRYAGDRYVQHSTPVRDGKEGFIEFFADFVQRNPDRDIEIIRGFEDGRYVFLHALQTLNGGESRWVTADIFDTDDEGRMIEHWDIIQEAVDETVSGHTQVDGPTEPTDLEKTEENKALVSRFATDVLVNGQIDKSTNYI
ncbi:MAG: SnoaL-like domain-containing protein, partial [Acidimicrobiia bacterium]|nr:SnoaL-like domain-containing protein [Acidimicrobiia bacterium]